jgi:hypothetical protein
LRKGWLRKRARLLLVILYEVSQSVNVQIYGNPNLIVKIILMGGWVQPIFGLKAVLLFFRHEKTIASEGVAPYFSSKKNTDRHKKTPVRKS